MKRRFNNQLKKFVKDKEVRYLFKNSSYKISIQGLSIFSAFFISWCFANYTSIEFYGTFLLINSIFALFTIFSFTGLHQSLLQYVAKGYDIFLNATIKKIILYSTLGSISLFVYSVVHTFLVGFNFIILICMIIGSIVFPFISLFGLYEYFLEGKKLFKKTFKYNIVILLTQNCLALILIFLLQNLIIYFLLYFGILIILNTIFIISCRKLIKIKDVNKSVEKEALKFGFFLTKYKIFTLICQNINNIIIGIIYSPSILAFYLVGIRLPMYTTKLVNTALSVQLPKYSQEDSKLSRKISGFIFLSSIILFLGNILLLPLFIQILFPVYSSSLSYGLVYSFILLIYPISVLLNYYFRGKIHKKVIRSSKIYPEIISLISIYPLFLLFGIYGLILSEFIRHLGKIVIYFLNYEKISFE